VPRHLTLGGGVIRRASASRRARQFATFVAALIALEIVDRYLLHRVPQGELVFGGMLGVVYALLAVGLILVYQSNRIINFAIAEFGVFGTVVYQNLRGRGDLPWLPAAVIGIALAGLLSLAMERVLARRFAQASRLILTVVTIGMAQFAAFGELVVAHHFGSIPAAGGLRTPLSNARFHLGGVIFDGNLLLLVAAAIAVMAGLEAFLHRSDYGVAMRAAAENGPRASLLGVPVKTTSSLAWLIAGTIAGIATVLQSPMTGVIAGGTVVGPTLLYKALTVAVIAAFDDLYVALLAGVFLGALEQSVTYAYSGSTVSDAIFVAIAVIVLLLQRPAVGRIMEATTSTWRSIREIRRVPAAVSKEPRVLAVRLGLLCATAALVVLGPLGLKGAHLYDLQEIVAVSVVAASCVVVTGWAGQVSLGQFAFAAVGAVVSGKLYAQAHWDFFASMIVGAMAAAAVSMLLGVVATRIRGFLFAVTSLGFAVALESYFLNPRFFSLLIPSQGFIPLARPRLFGAISTGNDRTFYYLCLVILVLIGASLSFLRRSRTGRVLLAVKENDRAARSYGVSQVGSLLSAFALAGFIAGIGGALFAFHAGAVDPGDYAASQSVTVFAMAVIGGLGSVPSAVLGTALIEGWNFAFGQNQALEALGTAAGLSLILLMVPEGIGSLLFRIRDWALGPFSPERLRSGATADGSLRAEESLPSYPVASGLSPDDPRLRQAPPPPEIPVAGR
jgi:branched-chain amino acid transport system permease protein